MKTSLLAPLLELVAPLRLVAVLTCMTFGLAPGQGQVVHDWTHTMTLGAYGAMITRDAQDAIYVTGHSNRIVTAKFAANGTLLWQVAFSNPGTTENAAWLTVDPFGDVLVAGYLVSASGAPQGQALLKYDPNGNLLWSHLDPSTGGLWSLSRVATDANGDVIVIGEALGGVVKKYSRAGVLLWTRPVAVNYLKGLAVDAGGSVFVAGNLATSMVTAAFDPAGNALWSRTTPLATSATDLALGPAGEVYVAGAAIAIGQNLSLVAKFAANGTPAWVLSYPGLQVRRLAVDRHGDVVCISGVIGIGGFDWRTQKISPAGTVLWSTNYNRHLHNDELPYALTIGPDDEIYVTGQGGPGPTTGDLRYLKTVTVRYSRSGVEEWWVANSFSLRGLGVARLSDNSIATVGESTFTVFHYMQSAVWRSLDGALAGSAGVPHLEGTASPRSAAPVTLEVSRGLANAPTWLIGGVSRINLPLFGGVLVPAPDLLLGGFTLSTSGRLSLPLTWPVGLPPAFEITFQAWIADPAAAFGFSASNGLAGVNG